MRPSGPPESRSTRGRAPPRPSRTTSSSARPQQTQTPRADRRARTRAPAVPCRARTAVTCTRAHGDARAHRKRPHGVHMRAQRALQQPRYVPEHAPSACCAAAAHEPRQLHARARACATPAYPATARTAAARRGASQPRCPRLTAPHFGAQAAPGAARVHDNGMEGSARVCTHLTRRLRRGWQPKAARGPDGPRGLAAPRRSRHDAVPRRGAHERAREPIIRRVAAVRPRLGAAGHGGGVPRGRGRPGRRRRAPLRGLKRRAGDRVHGVRNCGRVCAPRRRTHERGVGAPYTPPSHPWNRPARRPPPRACASAPPPPPPPPSRPPPRAPRATLPAPGSAARARRGQPTARGAPHARQRLRAFCITSIVACCLRKS